MKQTTYENDFKTTIDPVDILNFGLVKYEFLLLALM